MNTQAQVNYRLSKLHEKIDELMKEMQENNRKFASEMKNLDEKLLSNIQEHVELFMNLKNVETQKLAEESQVKNSSFSSELKSLFLEEKTHYFPTKKNREELFEKFHSLVNDHAVDNNKKIILEIKAEDEILISNVIKNIESLKKANNSVYESFVQSYEIKNEELRTQLNETLDKIKDVSNSIYDALDVIIENKERLNEESKKVSEIIHLNIGGKVFSTTSSTLLKTPSYFQSMLSSGYFQPNS